MLLQKAYQIQQTDQCGSIHHFCGVGAGAEVGAGAGGGARAEGSVCCQHLFPVQLTRSLQAK